MSTPGATLRALVPDVVSYHECQAQVSWELNQRSQIDLNLGLFFGRDFRGLGSYIQFDHYEHEMMKDHSYKYDDTLYR